MQALELVQVDAFGRWKANRGCPFRTQTGTDDNALKNVGLDLIEANARRFVELAAVLDTSFDDTVHTAYDPRHRPVVEEIWRRCHAAGSWVSSRAHFVQSMAALWASAVRCR